MSRGHGVTRSLPNSRLPLDCRWNSRAIRAILFHMRNPKALAALLLFVLSTSVLGSPKPTSGDYGLFSMDNLGVTIFRPSGKPLRITLSSRPTNASNLTAGPDGESVYWIERVFRLYKASPHSSRVIRLDLHSLATEDVRGVEGIDVSNMEARHNSILISGEQVNKQGACGLWRISVPEGTRETLLEGDCQKGWHLISLSADAKEGLIAMGDGINWVDLEQLRIRKLPARFGITSLSPDGKVIAATERTNPDQLFLLDPSDFSVRRELRWHDGEKPLWSPDGRYLLRGKTQFHCFVTNFALDVDAPHTPILVDVKSGKTKTLGQARCKYEELWGWIATR
jgi:hypothetical protein